MNTSSLERSMIQALHAKRFRETLDVWLERDDITVEERSRAVELERGIDRFDVAMSEAAQELHANISMVVPGAAVELDPDRLDGRLHIVAPGDSFENVLDDLRRRGFVPMFPLSLGADRAARRARLDVSMIAPEGPVTSVSVTGGGSESPGWVRRRIRPAVSDLRLVPLPTWAWWAYWGIKPIRLLGRAVGGRWGEEPLSPFLGTPPDVATCLLDLVGLSRTDTLVDLGCGDGRVLIAAASRFGCQGIGVEVDSHLAALAERNVARAGVENLVSVQKGEIGNARLDDAGVVFAFLPVPQIQDILKTVLDRMTHGARLIVHEQEEAHFQPEPDYSRLLVTDTGLTVAHVWIA